MSGDAPTTISPADYARLVPRPAPDANKYSRGSVAVIGGSGEYPGAPVMAAKAAARCGAGYVRLVMPQDAAAAARAHVLSIPVSSCSQDEAGFLCTASAPKALAAVEKSKVLVIGPGMGAGESSHAFLLELLRELRAQGERKTVVFDADALNLISRHPELAQLREYDENIVTPHEGEAARLLGRRVGDRLADARELAARLYATVVLKGPRTLVVSRDGVAIENTCAGPELAKAGTGDVLSGMIGSFAAQGLPAAKASALAVYLHGFTARLLSERLSVNAVMPEDIIEHIGPAILRLERDDT